MSEVILTGAGGGSSKGQSLTPFTPFSANSGNVNSEGKADILSYSANTITIAAHTATQADGTSFEKALSTLDMTGNVDGTYNIISSASSNPYALANSIYRQPKEPLSYDYTKSLTLNNNVLTGWTNPQLFQQNTIPFTLSNTINYEIIFKYTTGASVANGEYFGFRFTGKNGEYVQVLADPNSNSKIYAQLGDNNGPKITITNLSYLNPLSVNTTYTFKLNQVANGATTFSFSTDGVNFTTFGSATASYSLNFCSFIIQYLPSGSINLEDMTITGGVNYDFVSSNNNYLENAVWLNTSVNPLTSKKYNGTDWETFNDVPIGSVTIANSTISSVKTFPYNAKTVTLPNDTKPAVVVDTYKNGGSWYRVWSDGWIEQGGVISATPNIWVYATLLKPFSDTNYTVVGSMRNLGNGDIFAGLQSVQPHSTTQIAIFNSWDNAYPVGWYACGY